MADDILGIRVGVQSLRQAAEDALEAVEKSDRQIVFACANSNSMNVARRDADFRAALQDADQLVADGVGVTLVARLAGKDVGPRIIGQDYFEAVMKGLARRGHGRVFFFGSSEDVLRKIRQRFQKEFPQLELCGAVSPPFAEWDEIRNDQFIEAINAARPDVLWVGMTAPKQEKWVWRTRKRLGVSVIGNIGAVFDFYAGTVKPSPKWIRRLGLEAAFRLAIEPIRLWRRVLLSNFSFVFVGLWTEVLRLGRDGHVR